jgi:hypothetical protein
MIRLYFLVFTLLAMQVAVSWAGQQREEHLADSVRTAMGTAVTGLTPPQPFLATPADKQVYAQWLQRNLQHATLVHADSVVASNELFLNENLDALAGLKTGLIAVSKKIPGSRILDGQFTGIQQAISTKKSHLESIEFLSSCVHDFISSGLVNELIKKYEVQGVAVAPLQPKSSES